MRLNERGYTLIEIVIVLFVLTFTLAAVLPWLYTNLNQSVRTQSRIDAVEQGRAALRQFSRELRQANALINLTDRPSGKISISFEADLNGDGVITPCNDTTSPPECLTYVVKANELIRGRKQDAGNVIATGVSQMRLEYFGNDPVLDADGDGIVSGSEWGALDEGVPVNLNLYLDKITMIRITLVVQVRNQSVTITENVGLRNLNKIARNV